MRTAALLLALAGHVAAIELSKEDWDAKTAGKTVFVKFFAPWCGHCKKMKPDWDKLMQEFENNPSVLVADVDCTAAGKSKCDEVGVRGFPTLKYGDPNNLEDYQGGRSYDDLAKFAKENLGPVCGPGNLELCDEEKKALISKFLAMPSADLKAQIQEKEELLSKVDKDFEEMVKGLQKQYEEGQKQVEATKKEIKESGLGLMKSVQAHRKQNNDEL